MPFGYTSGYPGIEYNYFHPEMRKICFCGALCFVVQVGERVHILQVTSFISIFFFNGIELDKKNLVNVSSGCFDRPCELLYINIGKKSHKIKLFNERAY